MTYGLWRRPFTNSFCETRHRARKGALRLCTQDQHMVMAGERSAREDIVQVHSSLVPNRQAGSWDCGEHIAQERARSQRSLLALTMPALMIGVCEAGTVENTKHSASIKRRSSGSLMNFAATSPAGFTHSAHHVQASRHHGAHNMQHLLTQQADCSSLHVHTRTTAAWRIELLLHGKSNYLGITVLPPTRYNGSSNDLSSSVFKLQAAGERKQNSYFKRITASAGSGFPQEHMQACWQIKRILKRVASKNKINAPLFAGLEMICH
eukprot:scaffold83094_cov19-Tisochrysis_lutea.AAC.1